MASRLPVIMPRIEGQRFQCAGCTRCCRELVVHLFDVDRERIDQRGWRDRLGVDPYVRLGQSWVLNKHADGSCVFLTDEGQCMIHAKYGYQAKPLACQLYPFDLRRRRDRWQTAIRFDCPTVARSEGPPIKSHRDDLVRITEELKNQVPQESDRDMLQDRVTAEAEEVQCVVQATDRWLAADDLPCDHRLRGAAWVCETLAEAKLEKVRGERFIELVRILFQSAASQVQEASVQPPGSRARKLLRQLVYAYGQSLTLEQMRAGGLARASTKWRQLREARRYRSGRGVVPLPAVQDATVRFEQIESVRPVRSEDAAPVSELMIRYTRSRLLSGTYYGAGYYGWSMFDGMNALWLAIVVIAWQARLHAATACRQQLEYTDVLEAVRYVDRAAGRLPALGTLAERLRTRYLIADGGLQKLLTAYPLFDT